MLAVSDSNTLFASKHYLIIDDFQGMRSMMREMLKSFGAKHIDTASNGNEAVANLEKNKYDVVLCDYNLGIGRNGQQILEEAKHRDLIGLATAWIIVTAEKTSDLVFGAAEALEMEGTGRLRRGARSRGHSRPPWRPGARRSCGSRPPPACPARRPGCPSSCARRRHWTSTR